jgi:hypothetical protein
VLLSFSSQAAKNHSTVQKTFGFVKLAQWNMASVQEITPSLFKTAIVEMEPVVKKVSRRKISNIRISFHQSF